ARRHMSTWWTSSVSKEHGQLGLRENVAGCAAKDHLPQAALCVGALDQQVCTLSSGLRENDLTGALSVTADCLFGRGDSMGFQVPERVLGGGTLDNVAFDSQQHN